MTTLMFALAMDFALVCDMILREAGTAATLGLALFAWLLFCWVMFPLLYRRRR